MMVWEYFTHFHKSALCYTDVHVYRATSQNSSLLLPGLLRGYGTPTPQGTPTASSNRSLTACSSLVSLISRIDLKTHVMVKEIGDWIN